MTTLDHQQQNYAVQRRAIRLPYIVGGLIFVGTAIGLTLVAPIFGTLVLASTAAFAASMLVRNTLRTMQDRQQLMQTHTHLQEEYDALSNDYTILEKAYDQLQADHTHLRRQLDTFATEHDDQTRLLQTLLDASRRNAEQLTALNEVATALNATLDRDEVLACILRQLERVVTFDSASVQVVSDDELHVIAARGMPTDVYNLRISLQDNELARQVVQASGPVVLDDVRTSDSFVLSQSPIRSWIGAAMRVGERTVGILTVDSYQPAAYTAEDAQLVASFARQAAIALHNADLYSAAEHRAAETGLLLEMTRAVGSTLHLPEVLLRAAAAIGEALHADDVAILLLDEDGTYLLPQAGAAGDTSYLSERWPGPVALRDEPTLSKVIDQCCARILKPINPAPDRHPVLALPLVSKEQVLGIVLVATSGDDLAVGPAQLILAEGLATSAAIAIEQARLYEQARRAAQIEERSRLARELHDSVTQTLFSMTLTAEAARAQIDRNPQRAATQIDRLKVAAHQSLGEMRELLLQLRPTPLQEHGLVKALRDHIAALDPQGPQIYFHVDGDERRLAPHAAGLYRIAQEAIANAVRHAEAQHIDVVFEISDDTICLKVCDDGKGFAPSMLEQGGRHLGLTSMAERAAELGGTFSVISQPGAGTTLTVVVA